MVNIDWGIRQLEQRHNADNDIPDGPQVTYADYTLLEICKALAAEVEQLKKQIEELESQ